MKLTSLTLAGVLALSAGASFAQSPPPPGAGAAPRAEGHHWQRPDPAEMAAHHAQHLRDALQLRPDQEPALQAFVASMQPPAGERGREEHEKRGPEAGPVTTPERLDRMQARMAEHEQRFRAHAEAVRRFYAQLTPAQQKAFDVMGGAKGHGFGGHHGFHGGPQGHERGRPGPRG
jgi:hypothetical protein